MIHLVLQEEGVRSFRLQQGRFRVAQDTLATSRDWRKLESSRFLRVQGHAVQTPDYHRIHIYIYDISICRYRYELY